MRNIRWEIIFYIVVFVIVLFMAFNGYSLPLIIEVAMATSFVAFIIHFFYPLALEKRIDRVEYFLHGQKNTPGLYINYVLANRLEDESKITMEQLMNKYKLESARAPYKAAYGLYRNDMNAVQEAVPYIRFSDYRAYYETILLLEDGKSAQAREHLKSIKKRWMRSALLAEIELRAGSIDTSIIHARDAIDSSRGVHRYVIHKEYERTLPQAIEPIS
ncbi:hypothetical protein D3C74_23440 [compost metagenome]